MKLGRNIFKKSTAFSIIIVLALIMMTLTAFAQTPDFFATMGVERVNSSTLQLTADSISGTNVEYRFDMRVMGEPDYSVLREYSSDPNFTWTGAQEGVTYEMVVHALSEENFYYGYYVVFGNTDPASIIPFTGLGMNVTSSGNDVQVTAVPSGGSNVIYALQYREVGGEYNPLDPTNPYQASPNFQISLPHGNYEIVVHAIDMADGAMIYYGAYTPFNHNGDDGDFDVIDIY